LVQDTSPSPEIYLSKLRDGKCGGWGLSDSSQPGDDIDFANNDLRDCVVLWAVSVPGETEWYRALSTVSEDSLDQGGSSSLVEISTSCLNRLAAGGQRVEPLRAHKYPIPGETHCGVQIKVGNFSGMYADIMLLISASRCTTTPGTTSQGPPIF